MIRTTFKVYRLETVGNKYTGYKITNKYDTGKTITVEDGDKDEEVFAALKSEGIINKYLRFKNFIFKGTSEVINMDHTGYDFGRVPYMILEAIRGAHD